MAVAGPVTIAGGRRPGVGANLIVGAPADLDRHLGGGRPQLGRLGLDHHRPGPAAGDLPRGAGPTAPGDAAPQRLAAVAVHGTGLALQAYANGVPQLRISARIDVLSTGATTGFFAYRHAFVWTPRNLDNHYDMAILSIHPGNAAARGVHLGLLPMPAMFGGEPHAAVGGDTAGLKGGDAIDSLIARHGDDKRSIGYDAARRRPAGAHRQGQLRPHHGHRHHVLSFAPRFARYTPGVGLFGGGSRRTVEGRRRHLSRLGRHARASSGASACAERASSSSAPRTSTARTGATGFCSTNSVTVVA